VDNGAGNTIFLGDGSESIGGAIGDTIQGGSGPNQFLDGHLGHQSITGGTAGNETIWGAATDTVRGGSGGNETIAGVPGETTFGSSGANVFINATGGNQSVLGGSGGNETFWDDGATADRHDSISTFSQAGGDRVSLNPATDTPTNVVASATTSGDNTTVTFHDGSTLTFIGISSVNSGFFTTH